MRLDLQFFGGRGASQTKPSRVSVGGTPIDKLSKAQTVEDFRSALREIHGESFWIDGSVIEGNNLELVREAVIGFEEEIAELGIADRIAGFNTSRHGVMSASLSSDGTMVLNFNSGYFKMQSDDFNAMVKSSVNSGWWPKGTTTKSIAAHEAAHFYEYSVTNNLVRAAQTNFFGGVNTRTAYNVRDRVVSKSIVDMAVKNTRSAYKKQGITTVEGMKKTISGYGAIKNKPQETWAEAFADVYINGNNASLLSREIVKLAKDYNSTGIKLNY